MSEFDNAARRRFFFSSRRRHTRLQGDWSSDVCSSDLTEVPASLRHGQAIGNLQMPPRRYQSALAPEHLLPYFQRIHWHGIIKNPGERHGSIQNEVAHTLPSSIKFFTLTFLGFFERFRISSILANTLLRSTSSCAGPIIAASFPRLVIPVLSPRAALSTSSESFCFASNNPIRRMQPPARSRFHFTS